MSVTVLVCTVGGSPEPLKVCLEHHRPFRVIYVASRSSRLTIRENIECTLSFVLQDTQIITLENEQHLLASVCDIRKGVDKALTDWDLPADTLLLGDFTGGTKVMSAALVLALVDYKVHFTYVGGTQRTKEGLGIVENGHEHILPLENPWDALACRELQIIADAFAACQFETVRNTALKLTEKSDTKSRYFRSLATLGNGYGLWDSFDYKKALGELRRVNSELQMVSMQHPSLRALLQHIEINIQWLDHVCRDMELLRGKNSFPPDTGYAYMRDVIANAQRRISAGRHDDAVARLYCALEKAAKIRLRSTYGIDTNDVDCRLLPDTHRADMESLANKEGQIQIGLYRAFQLLANLGDALGLRFQQQEMELMRLLTARNNSLLAHGYVPLDVQKSEKLLEITLDFLEIDTAELPTFPVFTWNELLL